jgi:hypothetical protein
MRFHRLRYDGTWESENWSGYAVTGSSFTETMGSWTVPTVNCTTTPNTYASFWTGFDGFSSNSVEQTGTDSDCNGKVPLYYAWYEFYPQPSYLVPILVSPGNRMSAQVVYSNSEFTITILNLTTGQSYSKSAKVNGAVRSSAEWIAEAPCCTNRGGILPLSDFGTVSLGADNTGIAETNYAIDAALTKLTPIGGFGSNKQVITMVSTTGAAEAVPSSLTADGTSFTVAWKSE